MMYTRARECVCVCEYRCVYLYMCVCVFCGQWWELENDINQSIGFFRVHDTLIACHPLTRIGEGKHHTGRTEFSNTTMYLLRYQNLVTYNLINRYSTIYKEKIIKYWLMIQFKARNILHLLGTITSRFIALHITS